MTRLIAETLAQIQKLLDDHPRAEQAQARAFIDARYPGPNAPQNHGSNHGSKRGSNEPIAPVQNGSNEPVQSADLNKVVGSFLKFWSEYPKRTGKQEALKIWKKLNPDAALVSRILEAVRQQKTSEQWSKDSGQYIPHPKTWLNRCNWEDEPVQIGSKVGSNRGSFSQRLWDEAQREKRGES